MPHVLFVCVHNSGRSQMARAFFDRVARGEIAALSAGTMPDEDLNPDVVRVMGEAGIDISGESPKLMTQEMMDGAVRIITMGCGVDGVCPATAVEAVDWQLDDPKGRSLDEIRRIRDSVESRVASLWKEVRDDSA